MQCVVFYRIFPPFCACGLWMIMQCVVFYRIFPLSYGWLNLNYNPCKIKFLSSSSRSLLVLSVRLCDKLSLCCVWNCEPDFCWWFDDLLSSVWFKIVPACPEVTPCSWWEVKTQEPTPSVLLKAPWREREKEKPPNPLLSMSLIFFISYTVSVDIKHHERREKKNCQ